MTLSEVMNTARDFLKSHPDETVIMTMKGDAKLSGEDKYVLEHVLKYVLDESYPIYRPSIGKENYIPTLGEVRGKIVLISRIPMDSSHRAEMEALSKTKGYSVIGAFGMDGSQWDENDYSAQKYALQVGSSKLYVQDNYSEGNADKKLSYFIGTIEDATESHLTLNGANYLFNYSGAKDNLGQPHEINKYLMDAKELKQADDVHSIRTIGYVMTNYIDAKLSRRIFMTNFVSDHAHKFDEAKEGKAVVFDGLCDICGQYEEPALVSGVYQTEKPGELFWFASQINRGANISQNAILLKDINLGVKDGEKELHWNGIKNYKGTFDGNGHTISNAKCVIENEHVGIFASTQSGPSLKI